MVKITVLALSLVRTVAAEGIAFDKESNITTMPAS